MNKTPNLLASTEKNPKSKISKLKKLPVAALAAATLTACNWWWTNWWTNVQPQPWVETPSTTTNYTIMPTTPFKFTLPNWELLNLNLQLLWVSNWQLILSSDKDNIGDWHWLLSNTWSNSNIDTFRGKIRDMYMSDTAKNNNILGSRTIYNLEKDYAITFVSIPTDQTNNLKDYWFDSNLHFNIYTTDNLAWSKLNK